MEVPLSAASELANCPELRIYVEELFLGVCIEFPYLSALGRCVSMSWYWFYIVG